MHIMQRRALKVVDISRKPLRQLLHMLLVFRFLSMNNFTFYYFVCRSYSLYSLNTEKILDPSVMAIQIPL